MSFEVHGRDLSSLQGVVTEVAMVVVTITTEVVITTEEDGRTRSENYQLEISPCPYKEVS